VAEFAGRVLTRLHRKALQRGAQFRHLHPEARHQLRIALKKLRYTTEFFQGLFDRGDQAKDYLTCLSALQDALGHENDATMTQPLLAALPLDAVTPEVQMAVGALMGWQARDRIAVRAPLRGYWRRFKSIQPFWLDRRT
jgi:CHAD domain-containing protein